MNYCEIYAHLSMCAPMMEPQIDARLFLPAAIIAFGIGMQAFTREREDPRRRKS